MVETGTVIVSRSYVNFEVRTEGQTIKSPCRNYGAVSCAVVVYLERAEVCNATNVVAKKADLNF